MLFFTPSTWLASILIPGAGFLQHSTGHTTLDFYAHSSDIVGSLIAGVIARMWNNIKELQLCACIAILLTIPSCATVISTS